MLYNNPRAPNEDLAEETVTACPGSAPPSQAAESPRLIGPERAVADRFRVVAGEVVDIQLGELLADKEAVAGGAVAPASGWELGGPGRDHEWRSLARSCLAPHPRPGVEHTADVNDRRRPRSWFRLRPR